MNTLRLTLHRAAFEVMVTGEKTKEFRKPSKWILSRVVGKEYDRIEFVNGYGKDRPRFRCYYLGYLKASYNQSYAYSNGLIVDVVPDDIIIHCGKIIEVKNWK